MDIANLFDELVQGAVEKANVWWSGIPESTKVTFFLIGVLVIIGILIVKKIVGLLASGVVIGALIYVTVTYTGFQSVWLMAFPNWATISLWDQLITLFFVGGMAYLTVLFVRGLRKDHKMRSSLHVQKEMMRTCKKMGGEWHRYGSEHCVLPNKPH